MAIERTERVRMQLGLIIGLCARERHCAYADVDAGTLMDWANRNVPTLFEQPITLEQAQYVLDHPDELANR